MAYENKLAAEFETIRYTDFWKSYEREIDNIAKGIMVNLKTFPIEKVAHLQGEISAIDRILRLPSNIIEAARNQVK